MPDSLLLSGAGLFSEQKSLDAYHFAQLKNVFGRFEGAFSSIARERARFPRRFALVFQGGVPSSGLLAPLVQGKIVRNPEQRSTDRHLVSVAWRVNNHYTGRYQAGAGRVMRLRPSPHNSPMGADQRQRKVNRRRTNRTLPDSLPAMKTERSPVATSSPTWKEIRSALPTGNGPASISGHAITSFTKARSALSSPWSEH